MLSYRHAFHAGNHADVLKHTVLVRLLGELSRKDKPWWFVDTHAGAAQCAAETGNVAGQLAAARVSRLQSHGLRLPLRGSLPA